MRRSAISLVCLIADLITLSITVALDQINAAGHKDITI